MCAYTVCMYGFVCMDIDRYTLTYVHKLYIYIYKLRDGITYQINKILYYFNIAYHSKIINLNKLKFKSWMNVFGKLT